MSNCHFSVCFSTLANIKMTDVEYISNTVYIESFYRNI